MLYFFLSYARGDDDVYVERFYRDLCGEVRAITGAGRNEDVGFFDRQSIEPGQRWSRELVDALLECRSFLALSSPAYFLSEPCGREWAIFERRVREYELDTGKRPSALIPLLWIPTRTMPSTARTIQYHNDALEDVYTSRGLRQLLRLQRHRDAYLESVSAVAERIVDAALLDPPLSRAAMVHFDQIPSAFHTEAAFPAVDRAPGVAIDGAPVVTGSHVVHFVVAAASRAQAKTVRTDLRYYGDRPHDWAPYRPALDRPLGEYACSLAADHRFRSKLATIEELEDCIRSANQHNQIVVLLVDAWSAKLEHHHTALREYDRRNEPTTAVIIPWNHDDHETQRYGSELAEHIRGTFLNNSLRRDDVMFRSSVLTHDTFGAELQVVLEVARNRVFIRGTVYRRPPLGQAPRPVLEGP